MSTEAFRAGATPWPRRGSSQQVGPRVGDRPTDRRDSRPIRLSVLVPVRHRGRLRQPLPVYFVIGALVPLSVWLWRVPGIANTLLLIADATACAYGAARAVRPGLQPMLLVWCLFNFAWLCVGPTYQLSHGVMAWGDVPAFLAPGQVTYALALDLLAMLAVLLGSLGAARVRAPRQVTVRAHVPAILAGACLALTPYALVVNGGLTGLFSSREARGALLAQSGVAVGLNGGVSVALASILPASLAAASAHLFLARLRERPLSAAPAPAVHGFLLALALCFLYANPFTNTRFLSVSVFGSLLFSAVRPRRLRAGLVITAAGLIGLLGVYPLANTFRSSTGTYQTGMAAFGGDDFDGFQQVVNSVAYVKDTGLHLGQHVISALFYFVPRSVWTGKASPAGIDVAQHRGYAFTNLSLPIHAELYIEFGLAGMIICCFLLGRLWRRLDADWLSGRGRALLIVPYVALAQFGIIRGPLGSLAPIWITTSALLLLGTKSTRLPDDAIIQAGKRAEKLVAVDFQAPHGDGSPVDPAPRGGGHRRSGAAAGGRRGPVAAAGLRRGPAAGSVRSSPIGHANGAAAADPSGLPRPYGQGFGRRDRPRAPDRWARR